MVKNVLVIVITGRLLLLCFQIIYYILSNPPSSLICHFSNYFFYVSFISDVFELIRHAHMPNAQFHNKLMWFIPLVLRVSLPPGIELFEISAFVRYFDSLLLFVFLLHFPRFFFLIYFVLFCFISFFKYSIPYYTYRVYYKPNANFKFYLHVEFSFPLCFVALSFH